MQFQSIRSRLSYLGLVAILASLVPGTASASGDYDLEGWLSASNSIRPGDFGIGNLHTTIGLGSVAAPEYMGSDQYELKPLPMVEFVYGGRVFASTQQGIGYNLWRKRTFRAGPRVTLDLGRDSSAYVPISTLPDVGMGAELGLFMEAYKGPWRVRSDIRQEVAGGHNGMLFNFDLAWGQRWTPNSSLIFGGRTTYMGEDYSKAYFSVPATSAVAGLPTYAAESGFRDITGYAQLIFDFSKRFFLAVEGRTVLYFGSAADSPVTISNSTFATSAVIGARF